MTTLKPFSALVFLLALLLAAPALADERPRVAVLDLVTEGMPADVERQFESLIVEGLRKAGYDVVDHQATLDAIDKQDLTEGCTFGPCVASIAGAVNAGKLLSARVGAVGQTYTFVISMLEARGGAPIAQVVGTCPVCTVAEAQTKVRASIAALDSQRSAAPELVERSDTPRRKRSKVLPAVLLAAGVVAAVGGAVLVAQTAHDAPGWVTIGSGGTVAVTGLILLVGD